MTYRFAARQRGVSFLGMLFFGGLIAVVGIVGVQVAPTVIEYQAILKAVKKASAGSSVAEVRSIYERSEAIDDLASVKARDLEITKEGETVVVSFSYTREIHLVGPAFLLLKYSGRSK